MHKNTGKKLQGLSRVVIFTLVIFLSVLFLIEVGFRLYYLQYVDKTGRVLSDIEGVPFLEKNVNFNTLSELKNSPRIIVIGDYISGHKSFQKKTSYPDELRTKLNGSYEVFNTGTTFFSMPQELSLIKNKVLHYHPDILVVGYVINDIDDGNPQNGLRPLLIDKDIKKPKILFPDIAKQLWYFHKSKNRGKLMYSDKGLILERYYKRHNQPLNNEKYQNFLNELSSIQKDHQLKVIFTVIPIFYNFSNTYSLETNAMLYRECIEHNLTCIQMMDIFKKYDFMDVKEDDQDIWHPNAKGIDLIAEEIVKRITGIQ